MCASVEVIWTPPGLWGVPQAVEKGCLSSTGRQAEKNSDKTQLGGLPLALGGAEQNELVNLWSWKLKGIVTSGSALGAVACVWNLDQ